LAVLALIDSEVQLILYFFIYFRFSYPDDELCLYNS